VGVGFKVHPSLVLEISDAHILLVVATIRKLKPLPRCSR